MNGDHSHDGKYWQETEGKGRGSLKWSCKYFERSGVFVRIRYLYELETLKVCKRTTKCRLAINWGNEFIVLSNSDVRKRKNFHPSFRGKLNIGMLEVKVIFELFNLTDILKKQKGIINIPPCLNSGGHFSSQRISRIHTMILAKVNPSGEPIATPSCCL